MPSPYVQTCAFVLHEHVQLTCSRALQERTSIEYESCALGTQGSLGFATAFNGLARRLGHRTNLHSMSENG
jgi:hypothetical protein